MITEIAEKTTKANKVETDYEYENRRLREKMVELVQLLDLHDLYLELGNYKNIGPALKIVTWVRQPDGSRKEEHAYRTSDQITPDWLIGKIAEMNVSFQIRSSFSGNTGWLKNFIDNDIITSNARMMRPKGVDFYFDAWDDESKSFKKLIAEQVREENPVAPEQPAAPTAPAQEGAVLRFSNRDEDDWFVEDAAPEMERDENLAAPPVISNMPEANVRDWSNITEEQRNGLASMGWSEAEFNASSPEEQEQALRCIS